MEGEKNVFIYLFFFCQSAKDQRIAGCGSAQNMTGNKCLMTLEALHIDFLLLLKNDGFSFSIFSK